MKKTKICSVVVTYNRKEPLVKCLQSLYTQTHVLDAILIVDNGSSDGTTQMLVDHGYIQPELIFNEINLMNINSNIYIENTRNENTKIIYLRNSENIGGAGGFYEGQKRAFDLGFDWIWLMDDDGQPTKDCLEKLLEYSQMHKLKAANPLVIDKENHELLSFGLSEELMTVKSVNTESKNGIILNKANPFNGTLLHNELIKNIGFIKKEMFLWGDETEYFNRILYFNYNFATVTSALFYHPTTKTVVIEKFFGLLKIAKKPKKYEMNFIRNQGYINVRYNNFFSHKVALKYFIFFFLEGKSKDAFLSLAYYIDGAFDNFKLKSLR